jgi:hypothetical protein
MGGWVVIAMPRLPYSQVRDPVTIIQEAGLASGLVWVGVENITPNRIQPQMVQSIASTSLAHTFRNNRNHKFTFKIMSLYY